MSAFFSKPNNALDNIGNFLSSLNVKGIGNTISKGLNSVDKWLGKNQSKIGNVMSTLSAIGQLLPGGKIGDKIKNYANTIGAVGTALGGRAFVTLTVNQTSTNNQALNGHNILGTVRPANTPKQATTTATPQQFGTTPTTAPIGVSAGTIRVRGGFNKIIREL